MQFQETMHKAPCFPLKATSQVSRTQRHNHATDRTPSDADSPVFCAHRPRECISFDEFNHMGKFLNPPAQ